MTGNEVRPSQAAVPIRFAEWELDPEARELRRGSAVVAIQPRVLELLVYLVEHRERAVSKDELYSSVWDGTIVTETALTQAVKELRAALADDGQQQRIVRTVRGYGYRFVAEIDRSPERTSSDTPFVGRERLLSLLDADIAAARDGTGGAILLTGEPGIGKSRLLAEIAARLRTRGVPVFEGRCAQDDGAPQYWPWHQILHQAASSASLGDATRPLLSTIARTIPTLSNFVVPEEAAGDAWKISADQERFRFFESVGDLLAHVAPAAVILDDLHAADLPSLRLLQHVLRARGADGPLFIGAYRDTGLARDTPRRESLGALARAPGVQVTILEGFEAPEIAEFFQAIRGNAPAPDLVRSLEKQTRGNPFFLLQTLLLWDRPGLRAAQVGPVPAGVREAIEQHLETLSEEARRALRMAAIVGEDFDPRLLVGLRHGPKNREPFDEALAARVLVESGSTPGWLRFAHALIRETLSQSLTAPNRLAIHQSILAALLPSEGNRLAQIAHHAFEAARLGGDAGEAATWAERAATECSRQHAFEEEERHLERGLAALALSSEADASQRLRLMLRLARTRLHQGNANGGLAMCARVAETAAEIGDAESLARAAILYEEIGFAVAARHLYDPATIRYLEAAKGALDSSCPELAVQVDACLARRQLYAGESDTALRLARGAVQACGARQVPPRIEARALESLAFVSWRPSELAARKAAARQMLDAALRDDDLDTVLDAQGLLCMVLFEGGDLPGVESILADIERLRRTERWLSPWRRWLFLLSQGTFAQLKGRFADAERILEELTTLAREIERGDAQVALSAQRLQLRWWQGRGEEELGLFDWLARERYPRVILAASGYALLGRLEEARPCYEQALHHGVEAIETDVRSAQALAGIATACIALRDRGHAQALYERLLPWRAHNAVMRPLATFSGSIERYLAGLAEVLGRPETALAHWERSLATHVAAGAAPWGTRDRIALAKLLHQIGPRQNADRIRELGSSARLAIRSLEAPLLHAEFAELASTGALNDCG